MQDLLKMLVRGISPVKAHQQITDAPLPLHIRRPFFLPCVFNEGNILVSSANPVGVWNETKITDLVSCLSASDAKTGN